ncbi:MAG: hypothetical protein ABSD59_18980 [Terracidiphilus sp.]
MAGTRFFRRCGRFSHRGPRALAALVVAPQYIRNEANLLEEDVGILCVCGASLVALRYAYALMRALCLVRGMLKRQPGIDVFIAGVPVRLVESEYPLLTIEGLLASRIVASRHLFDSTIASSDACRLALAHEAAHARHGDNFKLFLLLSLSLPLCTGVALRRWRRAAEIIES